jgi:hypothetical protein
MHILNNAYITENGTDLKYQYFLSKNAELYYLNKKITFSRSR